MTDAHAAALHRLRTDRNWLVGQMLESGSAWFRARKARQIDALNREIRFLIRIARPAPTPPAAREAA